MLAINILSTIAIFSVATGIFFSFSFLSIKGNKALANKMLSILLFTFSLRIGEIAFYWSNYVWDFPHIFNISTPLPFLFGVLIYFYIKLSLEETAKLNYKFYLHLIPFILFLVFLLPEYLESAETKIEKLKNVIAAEPVYGIEFYTFRTLKLVHMIIYAVLTFTLIKEAKKDNLNDQKKNELRWFSFIALGFTIFIIVTGLQTFGIATSGYKYIVELDSALMLSCIFMIYSSIYFTVRNPDIFIGTFRKLPISKYKRSSLTDEKANEYLAKLLEFMEQEKPHLNSDLKLNDLSNHLTIPSHHLSQIINDKLNYSYNDFINKYRIKNAQELLLDPEYDKYTILSIAFEVGFKNKASFNNAFKKFTGVTPSQFKKTRNLD